MNYDDVIEVRLYNPTPWEIIQEIKLKKAAWLLLS